MATTDREDTISIFSRKVNTKRLTESSTTYCVLRSWVQDDPDRASNSVGSCMYYRRFDVLLYKSFLGYQL